MFICFIAQVEQKCIVLFCCSTALQSNNHSTHHVMKSWRFGRSLSFHICSYWLQGCGQTIELLDHSGIHALISGATTPLSNQGQYRRTHQPRLLRTHDVGHFWSERPLDNHTLHHEWGPVAIHRNRYMIELLLMNHWMIIWSDWSMDSR